MSSNQTTQPPVEPPKSGFSSVRFGVYVAQLAVGLIFTLLVRRSFLSAQMAETLKNSPQVLALVELAGEGITYLFVLGQVWVTQIFIKVSGQIAMKKYDIIGDNRKELIKAATAPPSPPSPSPATTSEVDPATASDDQPGRVRDAE
jgi:hypothetical protein